MEFISKATHMLYTFSDKTDLTVSGEKRLGRKRLPSFRSKYSLGSILGQGTYSIVRKGHEVGTHEIVAVKCIDELALSDRDAKALQREVKILKALRHQHVIAFKDFFYDSNEKTFFIVTEYCGGGEMFDAVVTKVCYEEYKVRRLMLALADAVRHLHERNITHRDLKPENILLKRKHKGGDFEASSIRIADFGFAYQHRHEDQFLKTVCGSPVYVAPEILVHHASKNSKGYKSKRVDVWSLGIIMYVLLCGYPPFMVSQSRENDNDRLFEKIKLGKFEFEKRYWKDISQGAKDLIRQMLCVNPESRLTVHQVLQHYWFDIERRSKIKSETPVHLKIQRTKRVHVDSVSPFGDRWSNLKSAVNKLRFLSVSNANSQSEMNKSYK